MHVRECVCTSVCVRACLSVCVYELVCACVCVCMCKRFIDRNNNYYYTHEFVSRKKKTTRTASARNYIQRLFGMKFTRDLGTLFCVSSRYRRVRV